MRYGIIAAIFICLTIPANAKGHHHYRHHARIQYAARKILPPQSHGSLTRERLADGQIIIVAATYASRFVGFLDALFRQEGHLPHVGCYSPTGHMPHSLHHWGGACDVGQSARNVAWRPMYHIRALAEEYGLTDGCIWRHPDCGHVDVSGLLGHYGSVAHESRGHRARASWYGSGRHTASGERYRPNGLTFASRNMPFGTMVRFTYRGRSVVARDNDHGPYVRGRRFDLSRGTARALHFHGVQNVSWKVVR